jgi:glycosyltransferase involved in cell wall biosynthesis
VVYNGAKYLEETIKSIINQTYPNIEYIIIDGGSTDGTLDVIKKYEDYIDYWVSEPDEGIYEAMNKGIILSNGEWLNFMNCGDRFFDNDSVKEVFLNIIQFENFNYNIFYGKVIVVDENERIFYRDGFEEDRSLSKLKFYMSLPHQSSFYNNSFFKKNGLYDKNLKIAGDYEFLLRNYEYLKVKFIDKVLSVMIYGGVSQKKYNAFLKEALMVRLKYCKKINLNYFRIYISFFYWIIRGNISIFIKSIFKFIRYRK